MRQLFEFFLEFSLPGEVEDFARLRMDSEHINDLARRARCMASSEGVDISLTDIQAEGRQQSAKDGKLREVVKPDDDDLEFTGIVTPRCDPYIDSALGVQANGHAD